MAKSFDSTTRLLLESGNVEFRYLASFDLASGTQYFGNHTPGRYISWNGQNWYGLGGLARVGSLRTSSGLTADECEVKLDGTMLTATPEGYEDSQSWVRDVLREDMINRRFELYELLINPSTGEPVRAVRQFAGPIDNASLELESPTLSVRTRSNRQAFGWATGRTRSDADQNRIKAGDRSLSHASRLAARGGKLPVGYIPSQPVARSGGAGGGGGGGSRGRGPNMQIL